MPKLLRFMDHDRRGRWAQISMDSGDPCWIGIARTGVLVKRSQIGLFGTKLYEEKNLHHAARTGQALASLYPELLTPTDMRHPALIAFANAVLHCHDIADVKHVLNEARNSRITSPPVGAPKMPHPSKRFDSALLDLGNRIRADSGLESCAGIKDAAATVLTHLTISALTKAGPEHLPHPTTSRFPNASIGACFMVACLTGISIRLEPLSVVLDVQDVFARAGFAVFHSYDKNDQAQILSAGGGLFKEMIAESSSRPELQQWLEGVQFLTAYFILQEDEACIEKLSTLYKSLASARE